ncbi:hypothetical protein GKE82_24595 [Conexibacter sp. W3-3-2]|nr:hypothetical protein [Conexibacter sp. W3-3-2]MTD47123.1 hypothetical protein [Conexibacter sp. W3-3-2]MTD47388.1 hypothetical protein [Conexibacter sp. W3-3-2]
MEYPAETSLKSLYDGLSAMCRRVDVDIANDVLVEMLREVADIRDRDGGPVHPTAGVYALVDGSALPGNFLQTNPVDEHVKKLRTRGMADNASFLRYVYEDGSTSKKWMGYKLVRLVCLATGMTIEQALLPASISEGAAAVLLVEQHFRRWPDSPLEYLVGDADYDRDSRVAEMLVSCFSVMPVFQARRDRSLGVPSCAHGHMNLRNREKWPTREARRRQGLERGVPMDIKDTRMRWRCPRDICEPTDTYFWQDVRANTYLPYAGDSNAAALRVALMLRRNLVESTFSNLKNSLASQQGNDKFKSHDEAKLEWLVAWATIAHSGKRLIHELGLYEPTHRAAQQLDLHRIATRDAPGFPIDQTLVKKITDDLRETFGGARAPRHIASDDS